MDLNRLKDPFPESDIEWRIQSSGLKNGKPWGLCLAYVTNRAIMDRLDDVCGPENWINSFREWPNGGVLCIIGVNINGEWVHKQDGAENTAIEAVKGGLSSAMKRAAVQWGIGRYLYNLEVGWADFKTNGKYRAKIQDGGSYLYFNWNPPALPSWALPEGHKSRVSGKKEELNPPPSDTSGKDEVMDVSAFHYLTEERGMTDDEVNDFINTVCNAKKNPNFDELAGNVVKNFEKTYKWWMEKRLT